MNDYKIEGRPATIFRTVKNRENPYVMIDRRPIDNKALSWKAKGLLTYLMSRPDGWEVSVSDLVKHSTDGEKSVRAGLHELRDAGHMKYTQSRAGGRITGWLIEVYEVPSTDNLSHSMTCNEPDADFLQVENLLVEFQDVENRGQVLKTLNSNESNIKYDDERAEKPDPQPKAKPETATGDSDLAATNEDLQPKESITNKPSETEKEQPQRDNDPGKIIRLYESNIGILAPMIVQELISASNEYPHDWIEDAFKIAVEYNKRSWRYVAAVLDSWKANGRGYKPAKSSAPAGTARKYGKPAQVERGEITVNGDGTLYV